MLVLTTAEYKKEIEQGALLANGDVAWRTDPRRRCDQEERVSQANVKSTIVNLSATSILGNRVVLSSVPAAMACTSQNSTRQHLAPL